MIRLALFTFAIFLFPFAMLGCSSKEQPSVVLYTSVDQPVAAPIISKFEKQTGIHVVLVTDSEASKSVGLAERLRAERDHPQADVWWDNECFLSINLADDGVLAPYDSSAAADIPAKYKDADHRWAGSALRVRVLVKSNEPPSPGSPATDALHRIADLADSSLRNRVALARPTAGTTGGQVAALYVLWGQPRADVFFHRLHDNGVKLLGGNSLVAQAVGQKQFFCGLCDNDDAAAAVDEGGHLQMVLPDQDGDGTLAMSCAVGLVANAPHPDAGKKLIDFLLSQSVDRDLIDAKFAYASARDLAGDNVKKVQAKFMDVDYHAVARAMPAAIRSATSILEGRDEH